MFFYQRQRDDELATFSQFAFYVYLAMVEVHYALHIGQTQTETFDVMAVACVDTVELIEYLFQVFMFHADTVVTD